ncbi:unnamed protein product [Hymenolepis diminuta]|uniref:Uncharacterized protein n=1 Tax=Hymenolepis diminuta TaxID=6216 RepID=A0A564Z411_HYMDI|nr:unnamed protein product [Hymenolepis diminuta]
MLMNFTMTQKQIRLPLTDSKSVKISPEMISLISQKNHFNSLLFLSGHRELCQIDVCYQTSECSKQVTRSR